MEDGAAPVLHADDGSLSEARIPALSRHTCRPSLSPPTWSLNCASRDRAGDNFVETGGAGLGAGAVVESG